jgi:hypothetical protein
MMEEIIDIDIDKDTQSYYTRLICIINIVVAAIALPLASIVLLCVRSILKSNSATSLRLVLVVLCLDIITCFTFIVLSIPVLIQRDFLEYYPIACSFSYFFYDGSILLSLWFLAIVSLERFFYIVLEIHISLFKWSIIMCTLLSVVAIIGIYSEIDDTIKVMPLTSYCFVSVRDTQGRINLLILIILNWVSFIITIVSYVSVLILTVKTKWITKITDPAQLKTFNSEMNKVIIRLLLILAFYLLTNGYETYLATWSIITNIERSQKGDYIATSMQNFNPLINCILLLLINKDVGISLFNWIKDIKS